MSSAVGQARDTQVDLLVLPELCITAYSCQDLFLRPHFLDTAWELLLEFAPKTKGMAVVVGVPVRYKDAIYNCACLIVDGKIQGFVPKQTMANDGIHYEARWFKPWQQGKVVRLDNLDPDRVSYPMGDLIFELNGIKIGFEICEDAWRGDRPAGMLAKRGVDIIVNPSASHFAMGKQAVRRRLVESGSASAHAAYVYTNLLGNEEGRAVYDGATLIANGGKVLVEGRRFSFASVEMSSAVVDVSVNRVARHALWSHSPILEDDAGVVKCPSLDFKRQDDRAPKTRRENWENSDHLSFEEYSRGMALGLRDYMLKSGTNGYMLSLSGGADSTAVACLVNIACDLMVQDANERGAAYVQLNNGRQGPLNRKELTGMILRTLYQGTVNSSSTTEEAAAIVAEALGAQHSSIVIDDIIAATRAKVEQVLGRALTWETDDITLQNMQPRPRAAVVLALANAEGRILLNTGNRSEASVGYFTLGGDSEGGLNPLAGVSKEFLLRWLVWLEKIGMDGYVKRASLACVNNLQPTAELRPLTAKQKDEDDLMPYPVLNWIEEWAIEDRKSPDEVVELALEHWSTLYGEEQILTWVRKYFRLFLINAFKRVQLPAGIHADSRNLDPDSWCRIPLLNSAFRYELMNIEDTLARIAAEKTQAK